MCEDLRATTDYGLAMYLLLLLAALLSFPTPDCCLCIRSSFRFNFQFTFSFHFNFNTFQFQLVSKDLQSTRTLSTTPFVNQDFGFSLPN